MEFLPFLLFILFCAALVGVVCGLFWLLVRFGRSDADELRTSRIALSRVWLYLVGRST